ncbi:protein prenyltransferase alpha subunit repeat-containing protein 1 isoform X2 [Anabrus simplex]
MDARQQKHRRTDPSAISRMLLGALLLNPDVQTFWNMRRELVEAGYLDASSELHFTVVVLSKKPKSAEVFTHRKWLLRTLLKSNPDVRMLIDEELRITQYAADRYANNYHAWLHRMWCLTHIAPAITYAVELYISEWSSSEAWISMHVSDHSGLQYRQFLLKQMCDLFTRPENKSSITAILEVAQKSLHQYLLPFQNTRCSCKQDGFPNQEVSDKVIDSNSFEPTSHNCHLSMDQCTNSSVVILLGLVISELLLNVDFITQFTGHEALWYHRRFALILLRSILKGVGVNVWKNSNYRNVCRNKSDNNCCDEVESNCKFSVLCCDILTKKNSHDLQRNKTRNDCCSSESLVDLMKGKNCLIEEYSINNTFGYLHSNCDALSTEKDQELITSTVSEEDIEICSLISKCVLSHEEQLIFRCETQDANQQRLSAQHHHWLMNIMELPIQRLKLK